MVWLDDTGGDLPFYSQFMENGRNKVGVIVGEERSRFWEVWPSYWFDSDGVIHGCGRVAKISQGVNSSMGVLLVIENDSFGPFSCGGYHIFTIIV